MSVAFDEPQNVPSLPISDINKQMLFVGIKLFSAGQVQDYGSQMAAATLVVAADNRCIPVQSEILY